MSRGRSQLRRSVPLDRTAPSPVVLSALACERCGSDVDRPTSIFVLRGDAVLAWCCPLHAGLDGVWPWRDMGLIAGQPHSSCVPS